MGRPGHVTAYLYTWDPRARKWCVRDVLDTEAQARAEARLLWKAGAHGIRIDVTQTVVEELRPTQ